MSIDRALVVGIGERCCGCDQLGASVACAYPGCRQMFHVPCMVTSVGACVDLFSKLFVCGATHNHSSNNAASPIDQQRCAECRKAIIASGDLLCWTCGRHYHPTCVDPAIVPTPKRCAGWQCTNCKSCQQCRYVQVFFDCLECGLSVVDRH